MSEKPISTNIILSTQPTSGFRETRKTLVGLIGVQAGHGIVEFLLNGIQEIHKKGLEKREKGVYGMLELPKIGPGKRENNFYY